MSSVQCKTVKQTINLCHQNTVKQLLCLRLILHYVGVGIHAKDIWMWIERKLSDVR